MNPETFRFGDKSWEELRGIDPRLQMLSLHALSTTKQDFTVFDGLRTKEEQEELVKKGASTTLNSKHLVGEAVDLVPYVAGKLRWEWEPIFMVARAMYRASQGLGIPIRWGGVWDREFTSLDYSRIEQEVEQYIARRQAVGKRVFVDGVHYELL